MKNILLLVIIAICFSCAKNSKVTVPQENETVTENAIEELTEKQETETVVSAVPERVKFKAIEPENFDVNFTWNKYDWLTEFDWFIEDQRLLEEYYSGRYNFAFSPLAEFIKIELPVNCIVYQRRLRNEFFWLYYQTDEPDIIFAINISPYYLRVKLENDNNALSLVQDDRMPWGTWTRVGLQPDPEYPLIGVWGELPRLSEYRIISPEYVVFHFNIIIQIPDYAIRADDYLLRQVADDVFETVSAFPDGKLRIEIINHDRLILTPLFDTPPGEDGLVDPVHLRRMPKGLRAER
jgi:hypothetical protein